VDAKLSSQKLLSKRYSAAFDILFVLLDAVG
jgi:hypothetical protein